MVALNCLEFRETRGWVANSIWHRLKSADGQLEEPGTCSYTSARISAQKRLFAPHRTLHFISISVVPGLRTPRYLRILELHRARDTSSPSTSVRRTSNLLRQQST